MKTIHKNLIVAAIVSLGFSGITACEKEDVSKEATNYTSLLKLSGDGTTTIIQENLQSVMIETTPLESSEIEILLGMKEEEKLAHDVYASLYSKWKLPVFTNISSAENSHMTAVNYLLISYGSEDTLIGEAGVFDNQEIQSLYNELVGRGSASITEALLVGALIEDMDIYDLQISIALVSNENIIMVFENLMRGSRNHLRAFSKHLTARDIAYNPVYISSDELSDIITSPWETGNSYRVNGENLYCK